MTERLGIFGGAFDPVHIGHFEAINFISGLEIIDDIQIIPNYLSPHKKETLISSDHRLKMLELTFKNNKNIKFNDFEIKNKKKSFTLETLKFLKKIYPEKHLSLIIGLDSLYSFTSWKNWEEILSLSSLLVVGRKIDMKKKLNKILKEKITSNLEDFFSSSGKILLLENDLIDVSSSEIKKKIKKNEDLTGLVNKRVQEYISIHSLYSN